MVAPLTLETFASGALEEETAYLGTLSVSAQNVLSLVTFLYKTIA